MADQWWRASQPEGIWRVYEDFRVAMILVWAHLDLPRPTPVQLDMARYIQMGPRRCIVEAFRGVGKSWITAAFVCWLLLRDPQLNIMVVSASKDRSDQFTTFCLRLIKEMDLFKHLTPKADQRESKIAFDVAPAKADHAPSVRSVGVFGQMTGGRADVIIPDDVEVPNNSETPTSREKLSERVKEFDAILKPGGRICYLGTPQTEESLYNKLAERGYEIRIWPARVPDIKQRAAYGDRLAPYIARMSTDRAGEPTDPKRFTADDLLERELSYGRSGFSLQFMLDTSLSDAERYPLRLKDLVVMDIDPDLGPEKIIWASDPALAVTDVELVGFTGDRYYRPMSFARDDHGGILMKPYRGSVLTIDPSGRGKDETGYAVTKVLHSQIFCPDAGAVMGGYSEEALQAIADIAKKHKVNAVIVETNWGGGKDDSMFIELLKPYLANTWPCSVEGVYSVGQKEKRLLAALEPVMNQHRLVIDRSLIDRDYDSVSHYPGERAKEYRLFYQMTRLTRDRGCLAHDDRIEALAMGVQYWVDAMALDAEAEQAKNRQAEKDAQLAAFMKRARRQGHGRGSTSEQTWLN